MMRVDETPKPVYYAFKLAAQLIGQKLTASGDNPQLGILAAKIGDKVSMLLSNTKLSPIFVQITVSGLSQNSSLVITTSGVDGEHGNNYRRRDNGNLLIGTSNEQIQTDKWQTTIVMPASNVRLIELQQH